LFHLVLLTAGLFTVPCARAGAAGSAAAVVSLEQRLPDLRYRHPKYGILEDITPRASGVSEEPLKSWSDEALQSPFFLRDVFRMRFIRQKYLISVLQKVAPEGLGKLSLWMGGQDLDPILGRFPWSSLTVAVVATDSAHGDLAHALAARLNQIISKGAHLPGYLRMAKSPIAALRTLSYHCSPDTLLSLLSRAVGSQQGVNLPRGDLEGEVVHGDELAVELA